MRGLARVLIGVGVAVGLLVALLLAVTSVPRTRLVDGYVLFLGGLLLVGLVRATSLASASEEASVYERALRRRGRAPARPSELAKIEREVALASTSSFDLHYRLRPILREVAAHRLALRGADLDAGSRETQALLGDELWQIVRPDREPPDDRFGPGLPLPRLRAALDTLERI
jgi:hypothetical protein